MVSVGLNMSPTPARARLQSQRGAAVFIVVMVLTLLTAVGIFAVRSASLADAAAGFDREGAQASLIAEYGVSATSAYLGTGVASTLITTMNKPPPGFITPFCETNGRLPPPAPPPSPDTGVPPACIKIDDLNNLQPSFTASNGSLFAPSNATPPAFATSTSSLNVNESTNARFLVELTDARNSGMPVPGSSIDTQVLYYLTLTAIAQVRPVAACAGGGTTTPSAAQTAMRAVITAGAPP